MATRKRTSRQTSLVGRAVSAGRRALKEAESRIPPDLRRQLDRRLKDADKTARQAIKQLQAQARKVSTRADVNSVLKRIDGLTRQARQIASGPATRATTTRRRTATTTRRTAGRTRKAASATRKPAASTTRRAASTTKRPAATTRRAAPRRRARAAEPAREEFTETIIPVEVDEIDVIEVSES